MQEKQVSCMRRDLCLLSIIVLLFIYYLTERLHHKTINWQHARAAPHWLSRQNECQIDAYLPLSLGVSVKVPKASEMFVFIMCLRVVCVCVHTCCQFDTE